jgi:hypothetical protein
LLKFQLVSKKFIWILKLLLDDGEDAVSFLFLFSFSEFVEFLLRIDLSHGAMASSMKFLSIHDHVVDILKLVFQQNLIICHGVVFSFDTLHVGACDVTRLSFLTSLYGYLCLF